MNKQAIHRDFSNSDRQKQLIDKPLQQMQIFCSFPLNTIQIYPANKLYKYLPNIQLSNSMNNKQNQQILQRFAQQRTQFRPHMLQLAKKYYQQLNIAQSLPVQQLVHDVFKRISPDNDRAAELFGKNRPVDMLVVFGANIPQDAAGLTNCYLTFIRVFPEPMQDYILVFVNTLSSQHAYTNFKKMLQSLPIIYYFQLQRIFVLQPSLLQKSKGLFITFSSTLSKYLKEKTVGYGSYEQLVMNLGVEGEEFLGIMPKNIAREIVRKSGGRYQLKDSPQREKQKNNVNNYRMGHSPPFNSHQVTYPKKLPQQPLQSYQVGPSGAPYIVQLLWLYFQQLPQQLKQQGLFRKSVDIQQQTHFRQLINNNNYQQLQQITNPHLMANLIKRFLANLTQPIIPYVLFQKWMEMQQSQLWEQVVVGIQILEELRRKTLMLILQFLIEKVQPQKQWNKMGFNNIAIVMGPCLMKARVPSINDLRYAPKISNVTKVMVQKFDLIFGNKQQRVDSISPKVNKQNEEGEQIQKKQEGEIENTHVTRATIFGGRSISLILKQDEEEVGRKTLKTNRQAINNTQEYFQMQMEIIEGTLQKLQQHQTNPHYSKFQTKQVDLQGQPQSPYPQLQPSQPATRPSQQQDHTIQTDQLLQAFIKQSFQ